jgi:hypothetical protein
MSNVKVARQDPAEIPVQGDLILAIRDRRNGGGCVGPDTGKFSKLVRGARQESGGSPHQEACRTMDLVCPMVVAQAFPRSQDPLRGRGGEGPQRRELPHPAPKIRDHRRRPSLLEHDLGHPYGVAGDSPGIAGAPGKPARVPGEPRQEESADSRRFRRFARPFCASSRVRTGHPWPPLSVSYTAVLARHARTRAVHFAAPLGRLRRVSPNSAR